MVKEFGRKLKVEKREREAPADGGVDHERLDGGQRDRGTEERLNLSDSDSGSVCVCVCPKTITLAAFELILSRKPPV